MTCPPNAFRTREALIRLEPGSSFTSTWGIESASGAGPSADAADGIGGYVWSIPRPDRGPCVCAVRPFCHQTVARCMTRRAVLKRLGEIRATVPLRASCGIRLKPGRPTPTALASSIARLDHPASVLSLVTSRSTLEYEAHLVEH